MKKTLRRQAGLDWRHRDRWAGRATVNAVCAMACAQTLIQLVLDPARSANRDQEGLKAGIALQASILRAWLDLAGTDEDAYLRRIALWLAAADASAQTDPKHLLECARSFYRV